MQVYDWYQLITPNIESKCFENLLYADLIIATVSFIIKMTYFMASALEKGLQLASRILQAFWLELIYDP